MPDISTYTWHRCRVQKADGASVVLLRAADKSGKVFFGLRQVWHLFAPAGLSYGQFFSRAQQVGKLWDTSPMDRVRMMRLGALGTHAVAAKLASMTVCVKTLSYFDCAATLCERLRALRRLEDCDLVGDDARLLMLNRPAELTPVAVTPSGPLPLSLPPCRLSPQQLTSRHGLLSTAKHLISAFPLKQQMQELKVWSQKPIQLDRDGIAIRARTWEGIEKEVYLFLGFVHAFHGIAIPNLRHFLEAPLIAALLSYHQAAGHSYNTINNVFSAIKRVLAWLSCQSGVEAATMQQLLAWVGRLHKQVRQSMARDRIDVDSLAQNNSWCSAAALLGVMEGSRASVMAELQESPMTLGLARRLHDALLGCFMFGWLPPQRPSCVRTLLSPYYTGPCMDPDCRKPLECQGNKVHLRPDGSMYVELRHHKNVSKWGGRPISYPLPQDLVHMVKLHCKQGLVWLRLESESPDSHSYLFVNKKGQPFHDSTFSAYFQAMMVRAGGARITPQHCRHIFVIERMSPARVPGPGNLEAAAVMGHSVRQWEVAYNPTLMRERCQQAVVGMDMWRAGMLAGVAGPSSPQQASAPMQSAAGAADANQAAGLLTTWRQALLTAGDIPDASAEPASPAEAQGMLHGPMQQPASVLAASPSAMEHASLPEPDLGHHEQEQPTPPGAAAGPSQATDHLACQPGGDLPASCEVPPDPVAASALMSMMPGYSGPAPALPSALALPQHPNFLLSMMPSPPQAQAPTGPDDDLPPPVTGAETDDDDDDVFFDIIESDQE